ncbi:MAG TPA: hypothetical protein VK797_07110 [Tepidisphaeraceae bacterium]|nr:hypothetical protein [Tepidisphaeraceae bacterium]
MAEAVQVAPDRSAWAKLVDPRPIYIFGRAGMAFTSGFYIGGYAVFLWDYVGGGQNPGNRQDAILQASWLLALLAAQHFIEFGLDAASSFASDFWRLTRRQVFIAGMALHLVAFALLMALSVEIPMAVGHPEQKWYIAGFIIGIEFARAGGDALISNTFDSWAVSALRTGDSSYPISQLFAAGRVANRLFLLLGAGFTLTMLMSQALSTSGNNGQSHAGTPDELLHALRVQGYFWCGLWGMAAAAQLVVVALITPLSKSIYDVTGPDQKARIPVRRALRTAFARDSIPAWLLYGSSYTMSMILVYAWPAIVPKVQSRMVPSYYAIPLGLIASGLLGSIIGRRISTWDFPQGRVRANRRVSAAGIAVEAVLFLVLASLLILMRNPGPELVGILVMIMFATRVVDFIADPFIDSLLHQGLTIGDEQMRAAVVSVRTAACNLLVTACFSIVAASSSKATSAEAAAHPDLSLALAAVAILGLFAAIGVWFARSSDERGSTNE